MVDSKIVRWDLITGTNAAALIIEWEGLQRRYQMYNKEVSLIVCIAGAWYSPYRRLRCNKIITSQNCNTHSLAVGFFRGLKSEGS